MMARRLSCRSRGVGDRVRSGAPPRGLCPGGSLVDECAIPPRRLRPRSAHTGCSIGPVVLLGGTWLDTVNAFPHTGLTFADLNAEVTRAKAANGWTSDTNSYFQIYTPSGIGSTFGGICGVHWFSNPAVGQILFPQ